MIGHIEMTSTPHIETRNIQLLATLCVLLAFASISTDLFLPALPTMQVALQSSEGTLQFAISGYLLGFGFGQLIWGPISDRFGRKGPVMLGIAIFVIGSAGCALSTDGWQLIGWRIIQALGASAGVSLARAMVRDLYDRNRAAKALSTLMTVVAIAPLLGPSIGAEILRISSWQTIFWTLVAIGGVTIAAVWALAETLPSEKRTTDSFLQSIQSYGALLQNRVLLGYSAAVGFYYSGIFANIAGGSFAFISYHHLSPVLYGIFFSVASIGIMVTNFLNSRLISRFGSDRMLFAGVTGAAFFGVSMALAATWNLGGAYGLFAVQFLFMSMNGLILANAVAGALSSVTERAGAASAVVGAIQYGSGMVGSALVGTFANGTPVPMGYVTALMGIGCLVSVLLATRKAGSKS